MTPTVSFVVSASLMILATLAALLRPWAHLRPTTNRGALPRRPTSLALAIALPLAAGLLYGLLGNRAALETTGGQAIHGDKTVDVEAMVNGLARKLEKNPDDPKGWLMLARSWKVMGRYGEAEQAFAKAGTIVEQDADLLAEYADVTAMGHGGRLEGKPLALVRKALALAPDHPTALWMAGTAAYQRKQYGEARGYWQRLLDRMPAGSPDREVIAANLEEIRLLLGEPAGTPGAAKPASQAAAASTAPTASSTPAKTESAATAIRGSVKLSPALASQVKPDDPVFVFARAEDGPRMPLAVLRTTASELPLDFELDPGKPGPVVVEARISKHGDAKAQSGDLIGQRSVKAGARGVSVQVDQVK